MFFGEKGTKVLRLLVAIQGSFLATHAAAHGYRHQHWHHRHLASTEVRVIQCVAFARWDAGIDLTGNARDWWENAAGVYERGTRPETGSVLSFRPNGRMPLGHVAVVSGIADSRTIIIDQSHWNSSGITRDIEVKDVSEENDWSAVRVQLGHGADFGSIYPTHGFIYPRPDTGRLLVNGERAPMPMLGAAPEDLRRSRRSLEVAEAPADRRPLDLTVSDTALAVRAQGLR